jgi:hypothetical protein
MKKPGRPKKDLVKEARIAARIEQAEKEHLINKFGSVSVGISYLIKKDIRLQGKRIENE